MRVFIVEDDNDLVYLTKFYFQRKGWQVETADNWSNLVETISAAQPDVIIMDNSIPGGGIAATQKIKSKHSSLPVIYCSGNNNIEILTEAAGADTFIKKPFDISGLEQLAKRIALEKIF